MTEIEQLRQDIERAKEIMFRFYKQDRQALGLGEMYDRLAKLEAEAAAKADPWAEGKRLTVAYYCGWNDHTDQHRIARYARHLEQQVEKMGEDLLDEVAANGRKDARIAELQAELAKRPVVWCVRNREKEYEKGVYGIRLFSTEKDAERYSLHTLHEPYTGEQS